MEIADMNNRIRGVVKTEDPHPVKQPIKNKKRTNQSQKDYPLLNSLPEDKALKQLNETNVAKRKGAICPNAIRNKQTPSLSSLRIPRKIDAFCQKKFQIMGQGRTAPFPVFDFKISKSVNDLLDIARKFFKGKVTTRLEGSGRYYFLQTAFLKAALKNLGIDPDLIGNETFWSDLTEELAIQPNDFDFEIEADASLDKITQFSQYLIKELAKSMSPTKKTLKQATTYLASSSTRYKNLTTDSPDLKTILIQTLCFRKFSLIQNPPLLILGFSNLKGIAVDLSVIPKNRKTGTNELSGLSSMRITMNSPYKIIGTSKGFQSFICQLTKVYLPIIEKSDEDENDEVYHFKAWNRLLIKRSLGFRILIEGEEAKMLVASRNHQPQQTEILLLKNAVKIHFHKRSVAGVHLTFHLCESLQTHLKSSEKDIQKIIDGMADDWKLLTGQKLFLPLLSELLLKIPFPMVQATLTLAGFIRAHGDQQKNGSLRTWISRNGSSPFLVWKITEINSTKDTKSFDYLQVGFDLWKPLDQWEKFFQSDIEKTQKDLVLSFFTRFIPADFYPGQNKSELKEDLFKFKFRLNKFEIKSKELMKSPNLHLSFLGIYLYISTQGMHARKRRISEVLPLICNLFDNLPHSLFKNQLKSHLVDAFSKDPWNLSKEVLNTSSNDNLIKNLLVSFASHKISEYRNASLNRAMLLPELYEPLFAAFLQSDLYCAARLLFNKYPESLTDTGIDDLFQILVIQNTRKKSERIQELLLTDAVKSSIKKWVLKPSRKQKNLCTILDFIDQCKDYSLLFEILLVTPFRPKLTDYWIMLCQKPKLLLVCYKFYQRSLQHGIWKKLTRNQKNELSNIRLKFVGEWIKKRFNIPLQEILEICDDEANYKPTPTTLKLYSNLLSKGIETNNPSALKQLKNASSTNLPLNDQFSLWKKQIEGKLKHTPLECQELILFLLDRFSEKNFILSHVAILNSYLKSCLEQISLKNISSIRKFLCKEKIVKIFITHPEDFEKNYFKFVEKALSLDLTYSKKDQIDLILLLFKMNMSDRSADLKKAQLLLAFFKEAKAPLDPLLKACIEQHYPLLLEAFFIQNKSQMALDLLSESILHNIKISINPIHAHLYLDGLERFQQFYPHPDKFQSLTKIIFTKATKSKKTEGVYHKTIQLLIRGNCYVDAFYYLAELLSTRKRVPTNLFIEVCQKLHPLQKKNADVLHPSLKLIASNLLHLSKKSFKNFCKLLRQCFPYISNKEQHELFDQIQNRKKTKYSSRELKRCAKAILALWLDKESNLQASDIQNFNSGVEKSLSLHIHLYKTWANQDVLFLQGMIIKISEVPSPFLSGWILAATCMSQFKQKSAYKKISTSYYNFILVIAKSSPGLLLGLIKRTDVPEKLITHLKKAEQDIVHQNVLISSVLMLKSHQDFEAWIEYYSKHRQSIHKDQQEDFLQIFSHKLPTNENTKLFCTLVKHIDLFRKVISDLKEFYLSLAKLIPSKNSDISFELHHAIQYFSTQIKGAPLEALHDLILKLIQFPHIHRTIVLWISSIMKNESAHQFYNEVKPYSEWCLIIRTIINGKDPVALNDIFLLLQEKLMQPFSLNTLNAKSNTSELTTLSKELTLALMESGIAQSIHSTTSKNISNPPPEALTNGIQSMDKCWTFCDHFSKSDRLLLLKQFTHALICRDFVLSSSSPFEKRFKNLIQIFDSDIKLLKDIIKPSAPDDYSPGTIYLAKTILEFCKCYPQLLATNCVATYPLLELIFRLTSGLAKDYPQNQDYSVNTVRELIYFLFIKSDDTTLLLAYSFFSGQKGIFKLYEKFPKIELELRTLFYFDQNKAKLLKKLGREECRKIVVKSLERLLLEKNPSPGCLDRTMIVFLRHQDLLTVHSLSDTFPYIRQLFSKCCNLQSLSSSSHLLSLFILSQQGLNDRIITFQEVIKIAARKQNSRIYTHPDSKKIFSLIKWEIQEIEKLYNKIYQNSPLGSKINIDGERLRETLYETLFGLREILINNSYDFFLEKCRLYFKMALRALLALNRSIIADENALTQTGSKEKLISTNNESTPLTTHDEIILKQCQESKSTPLPNNRLVIIKSVETLVLIGFIIYDKNDSHIASQGQAILDWCKLIGKHKNQIDDWPEISAHIIDWINKCDPLKRNVCKRHKTLCLKTLNTNNSKKTKQVSIRKKTNSKKKKPRKKRKKIKRK